MILYSVYSTEAVAEQQISERNFTLSPRARGKPSRLVPLGAKPRLKRRKREDKPVFLSIGYSTCHWCHVMAAESFENLRVAEVLEQILCRREGRPRRAPDIDSVYMSVCTALTGGGWPLNVIMTPEQQPFFAASYIPREDTNGQPGLITLLTAVAAKWRGARGAPKGRTGHHGASEHAEKSPVKPVRTRTFSAAGGAAHGGVRQRNTAASAPRRSFPPRTISSSCCAMPPSRAIAQRAHNGGGHAEGHVQGRDI